MVRWHRVFDEHCAVACAMCGDTVDDYHEKTFPEADDSDVVSRTIRLCPGCYPRRPTDKKLLEKERS